MPIAVLFAVANVIVGCYIAIRLGYGPPNWQTALNLVVRVTTLQDRLNEGRDWLDRNAPWADRLLHRLRVPQPIIIVYPSEEEEEEIDNDVQIEEVGEQSEETTDSPIEPLPEEPQTEPQS